MGAIVWVLFRGEAQDRELIKEKVVVETAALRKYQHLERLFTNTQQSLLTCNKKYDALLALNEQVNKDCDSIELNITTLQKRQAILNSNQKVLSARHVRLLEAQANRKTEVTIEYLNAPKKEK